MRLLAGAVTRRGLLAAAWTFAAVGQQRPAVAQVDGIPFYAPGDQIALPEAGFEYFLPRLEAVSSQTLPKLRAAVESSDWAAARQTFGTTTSSEHLALLGGTASILGEEAYTGLGLKAEYAAAAKKLLAILAAADPSQKEAQLVAGQLDDVFRRYLALIPDVVVREVRAREKKLQALLTPTATPAEPLATPSAPSAAPAVPAEPPVGGLLVTPTTKEKVCGVDIRC